MDSWIKYYGDSELVRKQVICLLLSPLLEFYRLALYLARFSLCYPICHSRIPFHWYINPLAISRSPLLEQASGDCLTLMKIGWLAWIIMSGMVAMLTYHYMMLLVWTKRKIEKNGYVKTSRQVQKPMDNGRNRWKMHNQERRHTTKCD